MSSSLILCWKDEADQHCNQDIIDQCWLSLPWISPSQSSHSVTPCYTGTDASVCTSQPFCRLQEQGTQLTAHSGEFVAQLPPLPRAVSSIYPLLILLWLSFPPHAVVLVLNFDETKPGVARGIYLFRSKYEISVNVLELQRRTIGQLNPEWVFLSVN